jgi:hypothetical protein
VAEQEGAAKRPKRTKRHHFRVGAEVKVQTHYTSTRDTPDGTLALARSHHVSDAFP